MRILLNKYVIEKLKKQLNKRFFYNNQIPTLTIEFVPNYF